MVHYWVARVIGGDDVGGYLVNHEIDDVRWFPWEQARAKLTYPHDRDTLDEAARLRKKTQALVVLRHSKARSRKLWRADDRERPLLKAGTVQAARTAPLLAAYGVSAIVTSSSTRCVQTVEPYAELSGWPIIRDDGLSEEGASVASVLHVVDDLVHHDESAVLCTHRPVLPAVFDVLGIEDVRLEPGGFIVVHHRRGRVVALEQFQVG